MEGNAKENDNFVIKVKSAEIIDGKSYIKKKKKWKKEEKRIKIIFSIFQVITLND